MPNKITNRQLFFILFLTLTAYVVIEIPIVMAKSAGTGAWLPILLTSVIFALFAIIIVRLQTMFQGKILFDYGQEIVGKFLSYTISVYFILYFLLFSTFLNINLTTVLQAEFFPKTPPWVMLIIGVSVFGCIAYRGVTNVARFFEIIGIIFLLTAIAVHIVMLTQGRINFILPLFQSSNALKYLAASKETIVSFLGIEILTVIPFTKEMGKKATATAFFP